MKVKAIERLVGNDSTNAVFTKGIFGTIRERKYHSTTIFGETKYFTIPKSLYKNSINVGCSKVFIGNKYGYIWKYGDALSIEIKYIIPFSVAKEYFEKEKHWWYVYSKKEFDEIEQILKKKKVKGF